jgi:NADH-quinone oxidoreductase subunit I
MAINVKVLDRPVEQVSYVRATLKGMAQTFKHLVNRDKEILQLHIRMAYLITPSYRR